MSKGRFFVTIKGDEDDSEYVNEATVQSILEGYFRNVKVKEV